MDDLEAMSSICYDADDNALFQRRIYLDDFDPEEDQTSNEHDGTPPANISRDIRWHSTPVGCSFEKTGYEQWLLYDWGDTVSDADAVIDEELGAKPAIQSAESPARLSQSNLRMPQ